MSIDGDDWAFNPPYARCHSAEARAELRREFVQVHVDELLRMHALVKELTGHAVPQVLLLHAGVADADVMGELLTAYERQGVRWIDLPTALKDPFYAIETAPAKGGAALPYRVARSRGVKLSAPPIYARDLEERLGAMCAPPPVSLSK